MIPPDRHRYEFRLGGATVESGFLAETGEFHIGDELEIYGSSGVIRAVEGVEGAPELTLILDLLPGGRA